MRLTLLPNVPPPYLVHSRVIEVYWGYLYISFEYLSVSPNFNDIFGLIAKYDHIGV